MLKNVRLRLFPTTTYNSLVWSAEGALALAAGENVVILVPKLTGQDGRQTDKKSPQFWHTVADMRQLIIDAMDEEIKPAPARIYSIGEEQGPGYAYQIAWSPLGMSRYRRCLLAVIATNHKMYIFEPVGHVGSDMRVLYDLTPLSFKFQDEKDADEKEKEIRTRLRSRCMGMAWSLACRTDENRWGESLIAVANDHLEMIFFRIGQGLQEMVAVLKPFPARYVAKYIGTRATHFKALRWSPWRQCDKKKYYAFLAYFWDGKAVVSRVTLDVEDASEPQVSIGSEPMLLGKAMSNLHPIFSVAFAPELIAGRIVAAYAAQLCTVVLTFDEDGSILSREEFENTFVERCSGLDFAPTNEPDTVIVQVLTSQGKSQIITYKIPTTASPSPSASTSTIQGIATVQGTDDAAIKDAPTEELENVQTTWPMTLAEMKQDYMSEYDITKAQVRTYGLAVSPLGGITAIAASFHPKVSLEYTTAHTERTTLIFGFAPGSSGCWSSFGFTPKGALPNPITTATEAVILESVALGKPFTSRIHAAISAVTADGNPRLEGITFTPGEDEEEFLAKHTLLSKPLNALRYTAALKRIAQMNHKYELLPENPHIIAASIVSALSVPRDLCTDADSKRILYSLACIGIMGLYSSSIILGLAESAFTWLSTHTPDEVRFDLELSIVAMRRRAGNSDELPVSVENGFVSSFERCVICAAGMVWRDLRIAECTAGHRFSRCAITFLPITDPMATRECSVCARTVLGADVEDQEVAGLAATVFGGWETCLLCGGRYWAEES
ncbi:transcription factor IIIC subunit delta N-term-domain-containing protein [Tricharina praecox]|uniref:transcription factor IIIC subunit delta N-term-domain-containing protein n=1 Tax=Tricharina praecox TaxID=43433 RepID=UPI002220A8A6|nr:transcription factor IIIC subunit delta N-term-domain-containing protein [Tricharina praecox]KAI5848908.1 transcription factor IIIC subunit delta N-term-domain-containing protein [Tricharina praecox]